MSTPVVAGQKRSKFFFVAVTVFFDRMEIKPLLWMLKTIMRDDITSWTEVNKKIQAGNIEFKEFTVYTAKTKYTLNSLHWHNYNEMKEVLSAGKTRDTAKEEKIYKSFW